MEKQTMIVSCTPGEKVRLRAVPSTSGSTLTQIPNGTTVLAGDAEDGWRPVQYGSKQGYMMDKFLKPLATPDAPDTEPDMVSITLPRELWEQLRDAITAETGVG